MVWAYYLDGFWGDAAWAEAFDQFVDDAALKCLKEWRGYVERVVYEHAMKPYNYEALILDSGSGGDGGEERVVRVENTGITDDYWRRV